MSKNEFNIIEVKEKIQEHCLTEEPERKDDGYCGFGTIGTNNGCVIF